MIVDEKRFRVTAPCSICRKRHIEQLLTLFVRGIDHDKIEAGVQGQHNDSRLVDYLPRIDTNYLGALAAS